ASSPVVAPAIVELRAPSPVVAPAIVELRAPSPVVAPAVVELRAPHPTIPLGFCGATGVLARSRACRCGAAGAPPTIPLGFCGATGVLARSRACRCGATGVLARSLDQDPMPLILSMRHRPDNAALTLVRPLSTEQPYRLGYESR